MAINWPLSYLYFQNIPRRSVIINAAYETGAVISAEEHQIGGFGDILARTLVRDPSLMGHPYKFDMIGVQDEKGNPRFGASALPWELMYEFGLSGEHLAKAGHELYERAA